MNADLSGSPEPGQPQVALRKLLFQPRAEQHDGRVEQLFVPAKLKPVEDVPDVAAGGFGKPSGFDAEPHRTQDLLVVDTLERHPGRDLVLPSVAGVRTFEKQALVSVLGHDRRRGSDPLIRPATENEWPGLMRPRGGEHEHLAAGVQRHAFDRDRGRRLEPASVAATSRSVESAMSWPTTVPSGETPNSTCPPLVLRKPHSVSAARLSCAVDFLNSASPDSPRAARRCTSARFIA